MAVDIQKSIDLHLKLYDDTDKGTLTAEKEQQYRADILKEEEKILNALNIMESVDPKGPIAKKANEYLKGGNDILSYKKNNARGVGPIRSDTEARITGLKNNWPLNDMEALGQFKIHLDTIYRKANYHENGNRLSKAEYRPGEREYYTRMVDFWEKIKSTPITDEKTRTDLLKNMQALVREGIDKNYVTILSLYPKTENPGLKDQKYNKIDYIIGKAIDRPLLQAEKKAIQTPPEIAPEIAVPVNAPVINNINPNIINNDKKVLTDQEIISYDSTNASKRWFLDSTHKTALTMAQDSVSSIKSGDHASVQNAFMRYNLGKDPKKTTLKDCLELNLEGEKNRSDKMGEFLKDINKHPINGNFLPEKITENAKYLGEIDKNAMNKLLAEPFPQFNLNDVESLKNLTDPNTSYFGRITGFVEDFIKSAEEITKLNDPDGNIMSGYMAGFGGAGAYYSILGKAKTLKAFSDLTKIIADENHPNYIKVIARKFLEKYHNEFKDKKLSDIDGTHMYRLNEIQKQIIREEKYKYYLQNNYPMPSYDEMMTYLEGNGPFPLDERFINSLNSDVRFDTNYSSTRARNTQRADIERDTFNLGKIYSLNYINTIDQQELNYDLLKNLPEEEKAKTDRIFNITLGNLIGENGRLLSKSDGFGLFKINGSKAIDVIQEKYKDNWATLTDDDKIFFIQAELLQAVASKNKEVKVGLPIIEQYGPVKVEDKYFATIKKPALLIGDASSKEPEKTEQKYDREFQNILNNAHKIESLNAGENNVVYRNAFLRKDFVSNILKDAGLNNYT
ncbi:MAG: hypothetical protein K6F99_08095, partial [Lachnospiraceae bacterium]|nr:hypothetical protein [Lachnospiraceae bacterium]